jgi:glucose/arabinose dehydrogenase
MRRWMLFGGLAVACGNGDTAVPIDTGSGDGGQSLVDAGPFEAAPPGPGCTGAVKSPKTPASRPTPPAITVPAGFTLEAIAQVPGARELAALPNGDLLVGSLGRGVYIVPDAEGDPGAPAVFATFGESLAQGVAFASSTCTIYAATPTAIFAMPYTDGSVHADPGKPIALVRSGPISPGTDGDVHTSTSVSVARGVLYAGVGSSCNACVEADPTRATVQQMDPSGANMIMRATRFRNAIALAENPATGTFWAGGAGQDALALGHPYEFFDAVALHGGIADYGWPDCEENQHAYTSGADCSKTVAPLVEFPAYSTLIGAAFYPTAPKGAHAFPDSYRGGAFVTLHGSWHTQADGTYFSAPRVAFVAMNGDSPKVPVDWSDPTKQWTEFVGGCQLANKRTRISRPTGVAVGAEGSLFVADDQAGMVYRVRPTP